VITRQNVTAVVDTTMVSIDVDVEAIRIHINGCDAAFSYGSGGYEPKPVQKANTIRALKEAVSKL